MTDEEHLSLFHQLYNATKERLYNLFMQQVKDAQQAEDLVQETYLKVWNKRLTLKKETLEGYIFTIAYNLIIDWHKIKVKSIIDYYAILPQRFNEINPFDELALKEFQNNLLKLLDDLPEKNRKVFKLVIEEKLSYKKASSITGIPLSTIEKQVSTALKSIRKKMSTLIVAIIL